MRYAQDIMIEDIGNLEEGLKNADLSFPLHGRVKNHINIAGNLYTVAAKENSDVRPFIKAFNHSERLIEWLSSALQHCRLCSESDRKHALNIANTAKDMAIYYVGPERQILLRGQSASPSTSTVLV